MLTISRKFVSVAAISSILTGCAHHAPEPLTANNREVVDVRGEHPTLNHVAEICRDRDLLCILAGFAILGGTIAVIKGSED